MIKISVITPVYNGENFIESCIKNVIDQKCHNVEHIIVDGGSTDKTIEIIKTYTKNYSHIKWLSEKDHGQSDAMNKGISMVSGSIIGFLNVDDYYEPGTLNKILTIFKDLPESSMIIGNCNVWDDDQNIRYINRPTGLSLIDILKGKPFPVNPSAYFYHVSLHDIIGLYDIDNTYTMDLDFLLRAVQIAHVKYFNETWGNFRYIRGTKTYQEIENGSNRKHKKELFLKYQKELPLNQKLSVKIMFSLSNIELQLGSWILRFMRAINLDTKSIIKYYHNSR